MAAGIVLCGSLSRLAVPLGSAMHEAGYRALSLPWRYVPFEIDEAGLTPAISAMRALSIRGLGISMPFKRRVMALCDEIDLLAARIGAVNTVVNDRGRLRGHNTDWLGAVRAIEEAGAALHGARALLLGAGGAARAVAFGLRERGAQVSVCNRTEAAAEELAASVGAQTIAWRERGQLAGFDVLVNATSMGMAGACEQSPLEGAPLAPGLVILDAVYKPLDTALIRAARAAGATAIDGSRMLLHQAAAQFELYTGRPAPLAAMDASLREATCGGAG